MLFFLSILSAAFAASCDPDHYWDQEGGVCTQCPEHCASCWGKNKCTSCDDGFVLTTNYICEPQTSVENCAEDGMDGNHCVKCADGYYLQGGNCHTCDNIDVSNCKKCNMNKCFQCNDGFTLYEKDGNQECIDCKSADNDEKCGRCKLGYFFNEQTMECQTCRGGCKRCTTASNCYLCDGDKKLADPTDPETECVSIDHCEPGFYYGNHCELCEKGWYVSQGTCSQCGANCARCIDVDTCVECNQGSILKPDNTCEQLTNCKRTSDLTGCLECNSGFYLTDDKVCEPCGTNCATCKDNTACLTCKPNYYFSDKNNGVCSEMNTQECDVADQYGCLHCKSEVEVTTWETFTNVDEIKESFKEQAESVLKYSDGGESYITKHAEQLKLGFYLPYTYNEEIGKPIFEQECAMCDVKCLICEHKAEWCTACNPEYQMQEDTEATEEYIKHFGDDGTKIYKCRETKEDCQKTEMGYCTECKAPKFLNGIECIECDESCSSCSDGTNCQLCNTTVGDDGNSLWWRPKAKTDETKMEDKGPCLKVNETTKEDYHLSNCDKITTSGCNVCNDGYYHNENWGGCKKCPSKCVSCENKDPDTFENTYEDFKKDNSQDPDFESHFVCTKCKEGDSKQAGEFLKDGECKPCKEIAHCVKCNGENERCESCASNYELTADGKCTISTLVIVLPIVSVIVVIIIVIAIIIIIIVGIKNKKKIENQKKTIRPVKVSDEIGMVLLAADNENFPLKTGKWTLDFEHPGDKVPIETEYEQTVQVMNPTKKQYFFEILLGASHKYELTAEPMRCTLKPGYAIEVKFKIKMLCTAAVKDEIAIVAMDTDEESSRETAKMTILLESDLSTKLDHTEFKLQMPAIGEGAFGIVFVGTYRGQKVAVKKMRARNLTEEQEREFKHEVDMLTQYRHACIVNLVGAVYTEGEIAIVTEFAEYGSLSKLWGKEKVTYDLKVKLMEDAVVALSYLNENNIIHRDVKGENILVYALNPHSQVCGKLTDFGTCRNISERNLQTKELTQGIGTPTYMAPECLENAKYTYSCDVYSFGIVLYETYVEKNAYENDERFNQPWMIPQFVIEGKRLEKPSGIPEDYWALVELCWQQEAEQRPTFPQVYATLKQMDVDITHTEMSKAAEALNLGRGRQDEEESTSSSSSDDEE